MIWSNEWNIQPSATHTISTQVYSIFALSKIKGETYESLQVIPPEVRMQDITKEIEKIFEKLKEDDLVIFTGNSNGIVNADMDSAIVTFKGFNSKIVANAARNRYAGQVTHNKVVKIWFTISKI